MSVACIGSPQAPQSLMSPRCFLTAPPHSVPVWIGTHDGNAGIITGPGSQKARNLRRDPRVAISLTRPDNPFAPVVLRGRVVEWIDGDGGWRIVNEIAQKCIHSSYPRKQVRVVGVIKIEHHKTGM